MSDMTQEDVIARIAAKRVGTYEEPVEEEPTDEQEQVEAESTEEAEAEADDVDEQEGEDAGEEPTEELEPEAEEEEAEGEEEAEEEEPPDDFFIARYRSREEAERGLAEKDAYIQRLLAERNQELQQAQQQEQAPEQLDREEWLEWATGEVAARRPREVFREAVQHGGEEAGYIVIDAMYGTGEPHMMREATTLAADYRMALQQAMEQERRAPIIEQQRQQGAAREAYAAREEMKRLYPDYEEVEPEIESLIENLEDNDRILLEEISQGGGFPGKLHALKFLYSNARASAPDTLVEARVQKARKTEERSRSKKIAASVASATASPERTPLTAAEQAAIAKKNEIRKGAGLPLVGEEAQSA